MLAIVIPYYKIAFFEKTIQSLANQTNKNFKVYIGNDASKENPIKIIESYKNLIDVEYVEFKENFGGNSLVNQWNRCIDLVQSEKWVMILGDDDFLQDNAVEEFYKNNQEIESLTINVIRYASQSINNNIKSDLYTHQKIESSIDFLFKKFDGKTRSSLSEYIFRKEKVRAIGFKNLPLAWHSDDLALLEFSGFKDIYTLNNATVYINVSQHSITGGNQNNKLKNSATFMFFEYLIDNYSKKFTNEEIKKIVRLLSNSYFRVTDFKRFLKVFICNLKYSSYTELIKFSKKSIAKII